MSNKRRADESSGREGQGIPELSCKRARKQTQSSSSCKNAYDKESVNKRLSVGEKELTSYKKSRQFPEKISRRLSIPPLPEFKVCTSDSSSKYENTSAKKNRNETSKPRSTDHQIISLAKKSTVLNDDWSRLIEKSSDTKTVSPLLPWSQSSVSDASKVTSPKNLSKETRGTSAQQRLLMLQEKLKQNRESKDHASETSSASSSKETSEYHAPVKLPHFKSSNDRERTDQVSEKASSSTYLSPNASVNNRLAKGSKKALQVTKLETTSNAVKLAKSPVGVDRSKMPLEPSQNRFCQTLPEQSHLGKKINIAYLPEPKEFSHEKRPSGCSTFAKKNLGAQRLERIQQQLLQKNASNLRQPNASTSAASSYPSPQQFTAPTQANLSAQTGFSRSIGFKSKEQTYNKLLNVSSGVIPNTENMDDFSFEEQMDWEPTNQELGEMMMDIQEMRTQIQGCDLVPAQTPTSDVIRASSEKSNYFIVLDSNILIGHLKFVEALRDRQFPVLEPLILIIPWVVIQELDRLKDWKPHRSKGGHSAKVSSLARAAVKWINLQLRGKHPRVKGQASFNRTGPMMACNMADDCILVCCKEMDPFAYNVVLLTEDVNLSNKALMLDIEVLNQHQLKSRLNLSITPSSQDGLESRRSLSVLADNAVSAEESEKSDGILCDVKISVRNYLEQVAKLELEIAYGKKWITMVKVPLPWLLLSEVVQVIIDLWMSVFRFVWSKILLFKELQTFLQDEKPYHHSLKEVQSFIVTCVNVVKSTTKKTLNTAKDECLNSLKQYQEQCEYQPAVSASTAVTDVHAIKPLVEKPMTEIWEELRSFCYATCELLKIEHDIQVPSAVSFPPFVNKEMIQSYLMGVYKRFNDLIFYINKVLELPASQVSPGNKILQELHKTLTQLSLDREIVEQYPSIESFAVYCANESCRESFGTAIVMFSYFDSYLKRIGAILED